MASIGMITGSLASQSWPEPSGGPGPAQTATVAGQAVLQRLQDTIHISAVPLDIPSYAAIMGSIDPGASGGSNPVRDNAAFQDVMAMIGSTLSQGQGGYYIAIDAPGGGLMTAMTPGQLSAYMQSGGTLYKDTLTSSNGHTYSVYDLLKQAFAASARSEQQQTADPFMSDPGLQVAETVLDRMRADSAPKGSMRSVLFGSDSAGTGSAKRIQTLVLQMGGTGSDGVKLSIVYFPPGATHGAAASQSAAAAAPTTLQFTT